MKVSHLKKPIRIVIAVLLLIVAIPVLILGFVGELLTIPFKLLSNFVEDLK